MKLNAADTLVRRRAIAEAFKAGEAIKNIAADHGISRPAVQQHLKKAGVDVKPFLQLAAVPKRAHPLVRRLFQAMAYEEIGIAELARRAGISPMTIRNWRTTTDPRVSDLVACFNVLGLALTVREDDE